MIFTEILLRGNLDFITISAAEHTKISLLSLISAPGQGVKQDLAVSVSLPTQFFPPFIGGG